VHDRKSNNKVKNYFLGKMMKVIRDKVRILQFPIANSYGGITHYALENWKWMDKKQFHCDFATMSKVLDYADDILKTGSKVHYISCYAEDDEKQFVKEVNKILDEGYDIVHLHTKQWKSFLIEKICTERKIPQIIVHSHATFCSVTNDKLSEQEIKKHYCVREQFNESMATDFWACSEDAADWLFGDKIAKEKIQIMKNAIDVDKFVYNINVRQRLRNRYGLDKKFVIGNVGRLAYEKNQEFLLYVFGKLYQKYPMFALVIVGDGELRQKLEKQATELGIQEAVYFLGKQENVNELYQMMDLFVLPSNFEGLPITLVEAQASGLRCLCSDIITQEVSITNNLQRLPLEEQVWEDKIVQSMQSFQNYDRKDMKKEICVSGYSIKEQIKNIETLYRKVRNK